MAARRGKMDCRDRAKQFMPFDALKGLREALAEKEHILEERRILSEDQEEELDRKLHELHPGDLAEIEYCQEEECLHLEGRVRKIDTAQRRLWIEDLEIPLGDLQSVNRIEDWLSP